MNYLIIKMTFFCHILLKVIFPFKRPTWSKIGPRVWVPVGPKTISHHDGGSYRPLWACLRPFLRFFDFFDSYTPLNTPSFGEENLEIVKMAKNSENRVFTQNGV